MGHLGPLKMLPTKPGVCPECAVAHEATQPHNAESMTYQYSFYDRHGRWPTWGDAMAHCSAEVQAFWRKALAERGVSAEALQPAAASPKPKKKGGRTAKATAKEGA
jgi:hypothetical protein